MPTQKCFWLDKEDRLFPSLLKTVYTWLFLVFGEPLKPLDLSDMLLQNSLAGGTMGCRPRPFFPYQKG
jgi:hypothetical protein